MNHSRLNYIFATAILLCEEYAFQRLCVDYLTKQGIAGGSN
jgi:hypothetical protein